ncbi:MAG: phosphoenolpyruvate carboxylase, partial [Planctomycetota bacterium]
MLHVARPAARRARPTGPAPEEQIAMAVDESLRNEIGHLGRLFGEVVRQIEGDEAFELIERVRAEARQFRDGDMAAGERLDDLLPSLANEDLELIVAAFAGFLELANLAEDRQRVRSLRDRERASHPRPRKESVRAAIRSLSESGLTAEALQAALAKVDIELVFTAHPTEAKRRSLRSKLRAMRAMLTTLDDDTLLPTERADTEAALRREILKLWQTSLIRPSRPTVLEEVQRGLLFQPVLWAMAPRILRELREAITEFYPDEAIDTPPLLRFGSWMGGDRDGHPHVTPEITERTIQWLRAAAMEDHLATCRRLLDSLSMLCPEGPAADKLAGAIADAVQEHPAIEPRLADQAPLERYRQWLRVIEWRLEQTAATTITGPWPAGAYVGAAALRDDVDLLREAVLASGNVELVDNEVQAWIDQIDVFGFATARLDLRQHSSIYAAVMEEVWLATRVISDEDLPLTEERRCGLLQATLPAARNFAPVGVSVDAQKTLDLFRVIRRVARRYGMAALGGHIVSMTHAPSDLLTILWLWRWSERTDTHASS